MTTSTTPGGDRFSVAAGTLVFTVFALSLGDALIKRFSTDFTLWQIFVVRSALALPLLIVIAYQLGPPSVLGTVDFAYVGFAALWGFILFAEVPDKVTLMGMILIVSAGVPAVKRQ